MDVKNLTFLYEPAIEFIVNITKQGIKVDNPKTLKVGDKIDIENADHKPYGVSGSVTRKQVLVSSIGGNGLTLAIRN